MRLCSNRAIGSAVALVLLAACSSPTGNKSQTLTNAQSQQLASQLVSAMFAGAASARASVGRGGVSAASTVSSTNSNGARF